MKIFEKIIFPIFVLTLLAMSPDVAEAQGRGGPPNGGGNGNGGGGNTVEGYYSWMHDDVALAFDPNSLGGSYTGVGSHLIVIDSFSGGNTYSGNLDGTTQSLTHGNWTTLEAHLVAPDATLASTDGISGGIDYNLNVGTHVSNYYSSNAADLNVVNLSFALFEPVGATVNLGNLGNTIISEAFADKAVFAKAAGNTNGGAVDDSFAAIIGGSILTGYDELNLGLIGSQSTIFVGALTKDGGTKKKASIARYSTVAGDDPLVQANFLVVGVNSSENGGLEGTSFAAPIVSGYAAILGDKFETASPTQVVSQLLTTAREDTIRNYSAAIHGQGEACLSCALSPDSIPY